MKHLSKEKKQQLLLVVIGTLGVLLGIWFGLISWQQNTISRLSSKRDATRSKFNGMTDALKHATEISSDLDVEKQKLDEAETQMASGDLYLWIINTVRNFKAEHPRVEIPQYSTILVGDTTLLPKFPYKQVTLTIAGKAYYHDLGTFVADFENQFPYIRLQNLEIQPSTGMEGAFSEKLSFRVDVVALIKPQA